MTDIESQLINPQMSERVPLLQDHPLIITKDDTNTASYLSGVFNLSCTIVGVGIMSLPAAMKVLGVIPGVLLIFIFGFLTKYSVEILLRYREKEGSPTGSSYMMLLEGLERFCFKLVSLSTTQALP